jgi:hypothetical protein
MSPEVQLILGCALLSAVVAYAWHLRLRVLFFRLDMLDLADRVRLEAPPGAKDHPMRRLFLRDLATYLGEAEDPSNSSECQLVRWEAVRSWQKGNSDLRILPVDILDAIRRAEDRVATFVWKETISDWIYWFRHRRRIRLRERRFDGIPLPSSEERNEVEPREPLPPGGVVDSGRVRS